MSAYTEFVRKNVGRMPGRTQQEKMRAVAAAWRKHKGQRGRGAGEGEEAAEARPRIVAPAGGTDSQSGGASYHAPRRGQLFQGGNVGFHGGSADAALRAANQGPPELVGGGPLGDLFPPLKMLGLGHHAPQRGGKFTFKDFMGGVKDVAGVVGQLAPVAMKLAPLIL